ncbi:MAG: inositol 2-dehydrogenase [Deltaproteobacteria bacterium]|nr:inositol 2-dehydrogenase [Deltaproteobacteria bacterium]
MKNLLLLGAGRIGQVHAKNVVARKDARLYGIVDVHRPAAAALAEATGAKVFDSTDAALADPAIDAVLICTSTDTHVEMILKAARAKKPIFCEKPVDLDIGKVNACLAEVGKAGVPLVMGFNRRFDPSFKALRDRIKQGELGELESIKITSRDPQPPPPAYVKVSGGLFRDMMIHDLDMARYLLPEEPTQVFATGSVLVDKAIGEAGDVDTAMVIVKTPSGRLAHIDNSRRAAFGYDQRIEAFGAKGMLQANNPTPTAVVATTTTGRQGDKPFHFFLERYAAAYQAELAHFLGVLAGSEQPLVTGEDGRRALLLADAANESLRTGRMVEVKS